MEPTFALSARCADTNPRHAAETHRDPDNVRPRCLMTQAAPLSHAQRQPARLPARLIGTLAGPCPPERRHTPAPSPYAVR
jgi:hypothetical protein